MISLLKLLESIDLTEADDRASMLAQTVKNPDTGTDISVKTALGYDKNHPARKAADRIYAQFMNKNKQAPDKKPLAARPMDYKKKKQRTDRDYDDTPSGERYKMNKTYGKRKDYNND